MIATDIVQEGLDVPECSFVIRYKFVSNEIGTVQSRGRARVEKSSCFLVVGHGKVVFQIRQTARLHHRVS
jgi:ERCC4-related helicase